MKRCLSRVAGLLSATLLICSVAHSAVLDCDDNSGAPTTCTIEMDFYDLPFLPPNLGQAERKSVSWSLFPFDDGAVMVLLPGFDMLLEALPTLPLTWYIGTSEHALNTGNTPATLSNGSITPHLLDKSGQATPTTTGSSVAGFEVTFTLTCEFYGQGCSYDPTGNPTTIRATFTNVRLAVAEPLSVGMVGIGLLGMAALRRAKRR